MFGDFSGQAVHHLSNLSAGYYAPLWVPVVTQLVYRWARYNVYHNISTVDHFTNKLTKQRNAQHRLFIVLAGGEAITFFVLARLNHSFLIPACYTLAHLVWTHYSKSQEKIVQEGHSKFWGSMDGMKPFRFV